MDDITLIDRVAAAAFNMPIVHLTGCTSEENLMMERAEEILAIPEIQALRLALKRFSGTSFKVSSTTMLRRSGLSESLVTWVQEAQ